MLPLIESIKLENGQLANLGYHNRRMNDALKNYFGVDVKTDLNEKIKIPDDKKTGLFRCRITYSPVISKIEFIPHFFREIKSLKLVEDNRVDYSFKFADRFYLEELFNQRGDCDDILIVKNGCIADSYTANPVFYDGQKWWATDTPLLKGTQRARLLEEGKIDETRITPADLKKYTKVGLINIFWDLENMPVVDTCHVFR